VRAAHPALRAGLDAIFREDIGRAPVGATSDPGDRDTAQQQDVVHLLFSLLRGRVSDASNFFVHRSVSDRGHRLLMIYCRYHTRNTIISFLSVDKILTSLWHFLVDSSAAADAFILCVVGVTYPISSMGGVRLSA
jgi:hypothetical protein